MEKIMISGFSDEISADFDEQLKVVSELGMEYISLRTADGKGIAEYTAEEAEEKLLPRLRAAGVWDLPSVKLESMMRKGLQTS